MRNRLTVSDVMTPDVITVPEDTPYKALVALMAKHHISALPVLQPVWRCGEEWSWRRICSARKSSSAPSCLSGRSGGASARR